MMNRRHFLASAVLLAAAPAKAAQVLGTGRIIPGDRDKILSRAADTPVEQIPNFRRLMRDIISELGRTAHKRDMQILVRNAPELLIKEKIEGFWEEQREPGQDHLALGDVFEDYLNAIDGMVVDGLYCGHDSYGVQTGPTAAKPLHQAVSVLQQAKRQVFAVDYAKDQQAVADIRKAAAGEKVVSYVDQEGDMSLSAVPRDRPAAENPNHVLKLADARNWLPSLQGDKFSNRQAWIDALKPTSFDLLVIDPFWRKESFVKADIDALKTKPFGSRRLVFARLPVGLAAPQRWYWKKEWQTDPPAFLKQPLPDDPNLWLVDYWNDDWKALLGKYFTGLTALGFDGFMIDSADAFISLEEIYPID
ncbi:MAG TPA: hypothetical protein VM661_01330 [Candidatus Sulfotelmatobacter sp.]|jgi:cysteinyl-tRNA synthetase|nr:hypothetical protein [Candidatus Sulfotelmatobacter sp.]